MKTKKLVHILLTLTTIIFIITGIGITEFRIVESITFGLLTKNLSFQIHYYLIYPFLILLSLHIYFTFIKKIRNTPKK